MSEVKPLVISRTPPYIGGREVVVDMLIRSLSQRMPVFLVTPDNYPTQSNVKKFSSDEKPEDILEWAKQQKVTVINCHTFYLSDLAFYLSKELGIPLVFTLHGVFIDFYGKKYGSILKRIYAKSNLVITVSDNYRKILSKYVKGSLRLVTIKNGIDLSQIDLVKRKSPNYYRYINSLPKDKFIVVIPARLTFLKGLDYLVEAANSITDKEIMFLVCSPDGRKNEEEIVYLKKLQDAVIQHNSNVTFLQLNRQKILEFYQSADVILLPSLIEGLSISLLEAMAFEKTVVATKVGGNVEIIENGKNGYLIKSKDHNSINKIIILLKKGLKYQNTGGRARTTVENKFLRDTMVEKYYQLFKKIQIENKQRRASSYHKRTNRKLVIFSN